MDQRKSIQMLMNKGRHQLSECHSMCRRLDGTKGILFMRRDVACETLQKHIFMLTSHLTNILDQRLAQIEQVCQEREMSLNEEKKQVLQKMTALTNMCGEANDYLQLGKESMCDTSDCEGLILSLEQILQTNIEVSHHEQHTNLSYEPLLPDNTFQLNTVGILKTSHLDPRDIEIKQSNGVHVDRKLLIVTKGQDLCQRDLEHLKVKLTDSNGDYQPVDLMICATQATHIQAVFANKQEDTFHFEVKMYGIHVVNSPYKFQVNTGIDNDSSYRSESSYKSTTTASSVDNSMQGNDTNSDVSFDSPSPVVVRKSRIDGETKRQQSIPDINNSASEPLSDRESSERQDDAKTVNKNAASVPSPDSQQDSLSSTRKGPVMMSQGKKREHRILQMPRAPLVSNRKRLQYQQTYSEQVSKSDSCKTHNTEDIRSGHDNSYRKDSSDLCKTKDIGIQNAKDVKDVPKSKPESNDIANNCLKDETVSVSKPKQAVLSGACQTKAKPNPMGCKINSKDNTKNSDKHSSHFGHLSKPKNVEPPGAYQPKIYSKFSQSSPDTRNVETHRGSSNNHSPHYAPYTAGHPVSYPFYGYPNAFVPYKPPALRKPHYRAPNSKYQSGHKQNAQQKPSCPEDGRVKLKLRFPHTCRRDLNIKTSDK